MIRPPIAFAAIMALASCSGTPFDAPVDDDDIAGLNIPESIAGSVSSFTYNPGAGTLSLTGTLRDEDELTTTFRRRPALDQGVYQAFTAQDDPLDEHTTVFVRARGDVSGAVAVTGGQFTYYSGGVNYARAGGYDPVPASEAGDTGLVTYAGQYIGLSNINGPNTDLLPITGPVSPSLAPAQASVVNGKIFINVGFDDNNLAGTVYDRQITTNSVGTVAVQDLQLEPTELTAEGTFVGNVVTTSAGSRETVGDYAGAIGGNDGAAMAGGLFASGHLFGNQEEEEFGLFVLGRCGGPQEDPSIECDEVE